MIDFDAMLRRKVEECKRSENQKLPEMPTVHITIPKMDPIKQFFEDREYDGEPFKLEGTPNIDAVMKVLREEQADEYMHDDDKRQTFHMISENSNNKHPYDAYFQRKRNDE